MNEIGYARAQSWSSHQVAEFVASVGDAGDRASAVTLAVERVAEAFEAEVAAIAIDDVPVATVGFRSGSDDHDRQVVDALLERIPVLDAPGAGPCVVTATRYELDGTAYGVMVGRTAGGALAVDERSLLRSLVRVLAMALRNVTLLESLRERQELLEQLAVIQRSITRRTGLDGVLDTITEGLCDLLGVRVCVIRLIDPADPETSVLVASRGVDDVDLPSVLRLPLGDGLTGAAMLRDRLIVDDALSPGDHVPVRTVRTVVTSMMAAPIREEGEVIGAVAVGCQQVGRTFSPAQRDALLHLAEAASMALMDARATERVEVASRDPLTNLPNRTIFRTRLDTALRDAEPGATAVLFVDVDGFKPINDTYGHATGDRLLEQIAERLSGCVRPFDTVARHGGDEFTLLLEGLSHADAAGTVAERVVRSLSQPFDLDGRSVSVSASVGVACDHGDGGDLLDRADRAMYHAKQSGKRGYSIDTGGSYRYTPLQDSAYVGTAQ